ncbi:ABC transporter permease subunit [Paenibacillus sp. LMG 31458]|uniref:ABC transporter permease subunit n=1 Tax=Paenibacillus phytorum TaxID=2654977 RepID=A0ABX1XRF0_9BACL|nr:carbohydrate ABC transporter permease [Paenibacillus phytorum]NOU70994.1 ABC transporter permease subunit [Paenibacillus phytorum]
MVTSRNDRIFNTFVVMLLAIVGLLCVVPLLYVVSVSVTPYAEVLKNGGYILFPKQFTFTAYLKIWETAGILRSLQITVFVTIVGTAINLILTLLLAYPLSRKGMPYRNWFLLMIVFTMLFSGGTIPTYLVVKATGLLNSVWALILPSAIWSFNVLIMKSFFEQLPEELFEAARMDGAKELRLLVSIVIPLAIPSIMTVGLFYAVGHWNQFFSAIMYISDRNLRPLQVVVRDLLMQSQKPLDNPDELVPTVTMQMAAIVVASAPIIAVYPFLQKHFTRGMLLGSVKG